MTARQRRLHQRLREAAPDLYADVAQELADLPLGYSARIRLPARFDHALWVQQFDGPAVVATKTDRGIEYVEDAAFYRKGWARPRPRLLPMRGVE